MKTVWHDATRREIGDRLTRLTADRKADWGRMSSQQMLCHLNRSIAMATGELAVPGRWTPFRLPILKQFILYYAPFPKNVPTAPELRVTSTPNAWEREVADFSATLDRFAARRQETGWPPHPAFGPLSAQQWGVLVYRHVDHHFRQFGV